VWRLLRDGALPEPAAAVFVTNAARAVAMWGQRAAQRDPIEWDYHVVALLPAERAIVDLDDRERVHRPLGEWLRHASRAGDGPRAPRFRVVAQAGFLATFSSDRSHMHDADGRPLRPLPPWPAPFRPELGMTLPRFLALDDPFVGVVTDADGLLAHCAR
jgi:hypothetical protein